MTRRAALSFLFLAFAFPALARADVALPGKEPALVIGKDGTLSGLAIMFDTGKTTLKPTSASSLDRVAKLLKEDPKLVLDIGVHTDARGVDEWNLKLSQGRADELKQALVSRGIAEKRIAAVGYGETKPLSKEATPAAFAMNRRVELRVGVHFAF